MRVVKPLVEHCFAVLELLSHSHRPMALGWISQQLDIQKSGAHRLLTTMCDLGWTEQMEETGHYRLTLKPAIVGQRLLVATGIPDVCQPALEELANETEEYVRMAVVGDDELTWVANAQGKRFGLVYSPEPVAKVPLHATANGKAWLATLSNEEATRLVLKAGFGDAGEFGPHVITTVEDLLRALKKTRDDGFATVYEESEPGVAAIAVPIVPDGAAAVGTISVAGPISRLTEDRVPDVVRLLKQSAEILADRWPLLVSSRSNGQYATA